MDNKAYMARIFSQMKGHHVWVMDLASWRFLRANFWHPGDGQNDDSPETATPHPGDTIFGYQIEVREGGGGCWRSNGKSMIDTIVYLKVKVTTTEPYSPGDLADDIEQDLRWRFADSTVEAINHMDPRA